MVVVIIFDLWNTLGRKNASFSKSLSKHFDIKTDEGYMKKYENSMQLKVWASPGEMAKGFLTSFAIEPSEENAAFVLSAQDNVIHYAAPFEGMRSLLEKLQQEYTLALLSNTTYLEGEIVEKWGFAELFKHRIYSFDTGLLKPSKEAFLHACKVMDVEPEDCLFIDDSEENCKGAKKVGMETITFESVEQLEIELKRREILSEY